MDKETLTKELTSNQVELKIGYWNPYDTPQEIQVGTAKITSIGRYGTPESYDEVTKRYTQSLFHVTEVGEVYMLVNSSKESAAEELQKMISTSERKIGLVGRNGKVTIAPAPEPGSPAYLIQLDTFSFTPLAPIYPTSSSPR